MVRARQRAHLFAGEVMRQPKGDLRCCIVEDRAIFIDVARNRYFALAPELNRAFVSLASGANSAHYTTLAEPKKAHLSGLIRSTIPLSMESLEPHADLEEVFCPATIGQILWVALILAITKIIVKFASFGWIVARFEGSQKRTFMVRTPQSWCAQIRSAFRQAELILQREDNCLPRSLAFLWLCQRRGYRPKLVVGVRIQPFAAHAWIQDDGVVLNDSVDNVRLYKPIFIL